MTKPLQVYMDEQDLERLEDWARKHNSTKSQAVRAAIRVLTSEREEDPLLRASGMIDGLPTDLSARIDEYLQETFVAEKKGPYRRRPRRPASRVRGH